MKIPFWIWIILGLSVLTWIIPEGIPGEQFILPAIAIGSLLIRRMLAKNFYQQQYQQYQQQQQKSSQSSGAYSSQSAAGGSSGGPFSSYGPTGGGTQGSGSFYSRFRNWGAGFQQPRYPPSGKDPYSVLGVTQGASMEEIKKAYREKLKKFHPDIVANLKLGEEYKEMFEEKKREIQRAYEQLGGK